MIKQLKKILLFGLLLSSFCVSAQSEEENYLNAEENRIAQVEAVEIEIENFISQNINNYDLTQERIDEIKRGLVEDEHEDLEYDIDEAKLEQLFLMVKKEELRELFFVQNPNKMDVFVALPKPETLQLSCVNGGFENGNVAGYSFNSIVVGAPTHLTQGCGVNNNGGGFPVGVNQFAARASLVTPGSEPLLQALGFTVNRVNAGGFSLKINPTPVNPGGNVSNDGEEGNVTSVSTVPFNIDEATIDFNFLLFGKVVAGNAHIQPFFRYRLIDNATNAVLRNVCIPMGFNDCRFARLNEIRPGFNPADRISYTPQWVCESINTGNLIGREVRLEFTVSDCEYRGHFATAYIDNLCGMHCPPTWGSINLNPVNQNCPTSSFDVCGSFQLPANTTASNLVLNVLNGNGTVIGTVNNPVINSNNFCFSVNPNVFGANPSGSFSFQVTATLTMTCAPNPPTTYQVTGSTNGVTFNNCCPSTLLITVAVNNNSANNVSLREASNWIKATNVINVGNALTGDGVVYHAGNYVELNPGFEAVSGSQFSSYILGCTGGFVYKNSEPKNENVAVEVLEDNKIDLVRNTRNLRVYPNPTNGWVTFSFGEKVIQTVTVSSIDGKTKSFVNRENSTEFKIDMTNFSDGIYILSVETKDGQIINSKLVKN